MMRYKKKEGLVCEQIDDQIIVFESNKEKFFEIDGVGAYLWDIIEYNDLTSIVKKLCDEYDVDELTALEDISIFISELENNCLLYQIEEK